MELKENFVVPFEIRLASYRTIHIQQCTMLAMFLMCIGYGYGYDFVDL